jgi:DNA (cytosine-5)-methyltransferase 1
MKLLDLFCGAGGAAVGYSRAGFDEIIGVDINPQPHYPFEFIRGDALEYLRSHGAEFDAIHASPPCQFATRMASIGKARNGSYPEHINFIPETRTEILKLHKPYVIENVSGARGHLINPVMLCGSQFGLHVYRHRFFECNFSVEQPPHYPHRDKTPSAGNGVSPKGFISVCGTGGVKGMKSNEIIKYWQYAMGIDWTSDRHEIAEAIPPAYTEYIGKYLIDACNSGGGDV